MARSADASPLLTLGVMARSRKENEHRLPIHPEHVDSIDPELRSQIFVEEGYGLPFGVSDETLAGALGGVRTRARLIVECDVILLPKVQAEDLAELRDGQIVWGWPHCVQDPVLTQEAIDRRLTLIAFEAMNHWARDGSFLLHVFHLNNELAGYSSVLHALALLGRTGTYGRKLRAVVIGFGATARGAVTALSAQGIDDVRVLTARKVAAVASPIHSVQIVHLDHDDDDPSQTRVVTNDGRVPLSSYLADNDIVVNCVLQDTEAPWTFLREEELSAFRPGSLIVDVSCDEGMGFSWARPTSFEDPTFVVGDNITYYAVDHTPSYFWDSATWVNSEALLPHLRTVLSGPQAWAAEPTIDRAIEIQDGVIRNPNILTFQDREADYPHPVRPSA
ncbi:N(5)-(carboxyethyl)ornithine synthase [Ornithinimicrobium cryptoxanthini]|uniref:N(5)-(Carboxyethyl)ornithine synthase n=1 Tax=Ornithinimicrobium cryptoxanthini TaxID=2934161 RepID=A0ABY4YGA3_9MICO|nr:N(5)-(carboxyethyl)ornithine synthase [Ornithinimicrobium cryptoxanthini]USQ75634.1 N(5)-(carboxyethyl)ornithine synthase [Ornithinimicrobium cryptoxanthini]